MINFIPDLTEIVNGTTPMEQVQIITKQPFSWLPIAVIFVFIILYFIFIGLVTGTTRKKTIQQPNFWLLFLGIIMGVVFYLVVIFFPFWVDIFTK